MEQLKMELETCAAHPALRRFVRYYGQRRLAAGANLQEPVTARLGGLLEFHFAGLYRVPSYGTKQYEPCAPMLAVGPMTSRRQLQADGAIEALTVMLQPCGLFELFGVPTHLLTDHAAEAHSLLGVSISQLYARLGEARIFAERVRLLDRFLLAKATAQPRTANIIWGRAFMSITQHQGPLSIRGMAASLNVSVRQLERRSLEYAGMTPQTVARVARFLRALALHRSPNQRHSMNWTEIAQAAGYYDQMHLIRDFRIMGGATPKTLAAQLEPHHGASLLVSSTKSFGLQQ
jgi:AraC-like DNA-binding protein